MKIALFLSPLLIVSPILGLKVSVEEEVRAAAPPIGAGTRLFFNWCDFYQGNCVSGCSSKTLFGSVSS